MVRTSILVATLVAGLLAGTAVNAALVAAPLNGQQLIQGSSSLCIGDCVLEQGVLVAGQGGATVQQFDVFIDPLTGEILDGGGAISDGEGFLYLSPDGNVDPFITASIGATDFGTPSSFAVAVVAPLLPTFPVGSVLASTASILGSLTDATGDGVSASLLPPSSALLETLINGVPVNSAGPAANATGPYGPYANTINYVCPAGGCTSFGLLLSWTGSGNGDQYSFTGTHNIQQVQVPEPITLALVGLGIAGIGFQRRKQTKVA